MHKISLVILLSSIERNDTKDFNDNFDDALARRLCDKLVDRALLTRSMCRQDLQSTVDHATLAKSGQKLLTYPGEQKSIPMVSLKDRLKAPWRRFQSARPAQPGQGATAEQVDHEDFRIPPQLGVSSPLRHRATASAEDGSEYLGRLASFPGVSPEIITPEEAASIRIAGLTPIETPESLTPRETPETRIDDLGGLHEEPQAAIDSDIDSDIMNAPRKHLGSESSDGDMTGDAETGIMDSPRSTDKQIEDNVLKAWRYSHGLNSYSDIKNFKALAEHPPNTSK